MTRLAYHTSYIAIWSFAFCAWSSGYAQSPSPSPQPPTTPPGGSVPYSPLDRNHLFRGGILHLRDFFKYGSGEWPLDGAPEQPPLPAPAFNPDPGGSYQKQKMPPEPMSLFDDEPMYPPAYQGPEIPGPLQRPRRDVHGPLRVEHQYDYPKYPQPDTLPPYSSATANRWYINFGRWKRVQDPSTDTPYQYETPRLYHPYQQSILKGDVPIIGQDIFTSITMKNFTLAEFRKLPTSSGISTAQPHELRVLWAGRAVLSLQRYVPEPRYLQG